MKVLFISFHLNGSHTRVSSTDQKVRTTLYSKINSTTWKYCSIYSFHLNGPQVWSTVLKVNTTHDKVTITHWQMLNETYLKCSVHCRESHTNSKHADLVNLFFTRVHSKTKLAEEGKSPVSSHVNKHHSIFEENVFFNSTKSQFLLPILCACPRTWKVAEKLYFPHNRAILFLAVLNIIDSFPVLF